MFIGSGISSITIMKLALLFEENCKNQAKKLKFPFCVAAGYAQFDIERDITVSDILRRADHTMYRRKHMQKSDECVVEKGLL